MHLEHLLRVPIIYCNSFQEENIGDKNVNYHGMRGNIPSLATSRHHSTIPAKEQTFKRPCKITH